MNKKRALIALAIIVVTTISCIGNKEVKTAELTNRVWNLTSISVNDKDIALGENTPFITFNDSVSFSGTTGCNRFMGTYTITGNTLQLDVQALTRMLCPDMELENQIVEAFKLPLTVDFDADGTELELENDANDIEMEFKQALGCTTSVE